MASPSNKNVLLGRGALYFDRYDAAGVRTGFQHLGNCDSLGIGIETEMLEMKDYTQETGANYAETLVGTDVNISITGFEFDDHQLALALLGDQTTLTQTLQTVTAESLAGAAVTGVKGKYFRTAYRNISAVILDQGVTELVLGTDYEITNAATGLIRILPTSPTVTDGSAITIDYSAAAIAAPNALTVIRGAVVSKIEGMLLFVPKNSTGPKNELVVWRASLTPNGELGLISDEYAKWSLQGKALSDAAGEYGGSASDPYFRLVKQAA